MIFTIPFIAFWFARVTGIPQRAANAFKLKSFKPFTCSKCMGFWLGLAYQLTEWRGIDSMIIICLTSLCAFIIEWVCEYKIKMYLNV